MLIFGVIRLSCGCRCNCGGEGNKGSFNFGCWADYPRPRPWAKKKLWNRHSLVQGSALLHHQSIMSHILFKNTQHSKNSCQIFARFSYGTNSWYILSRNFGDLHILIYKLKFDVLNMIIMDMLKRTSNSSALNNLQECVRLL